MSKIVKLLISNNPDDHKLAKIVINKRRQLKRDLLSICKYTYPRDRGTVTRSFKQYCDIEAITYHNYADDDLRRTINIARGHCNLKPTGLYYKKATEARKRIEKDQY